MILRSGKIYGDIQPIIDFDYASDMWRQNKIYVGSGMFKYKHTRTR